MVKNSTDAATDTGDTESTPLIDTQSVIAAKERDLARHQEHIEALKSQISESKKGQSKRGMKGLVGAGALMAILAIIILANPVGLGLAVCIGLATVAGGYTLVQAGQFGLKMKDNTQAQLAITKENAKIRGIGDRVTKLSDSLEYVNAPEPVRTALSTVATANETVRHKNMENVLKPAVATANLQAQVSKLTTTVSRLQRDNENLRYDLDSARGGSDTDSRGSDTDSMSGSSIDSDNESEHGQPVRPWVRPRNTSGTQPRFGHDESIGRGSDYRNYSVPQPLSQEQMNDLDARIGITAPQARHPNPHVTHSPMQQNPHHSAHHVPHYAGDDHYAAGRGAAYR